MKVMAYGRETQSFMKKGGQQKYLDKALPSGSPKQTSTKHFFSLLTVNKILSPNGRYRLTLYPKNITQIIASHKDVLTKCLYLLKLLIFVVEFTSCSREYLPGYKNFATWPLEGLHYWKQNVKGNRHWTSYMVWRGVWGPPFQTRPFSSLGPPVIQGSKFPPFSFSILHMIAWNSPNCEMYKRHKMQVTGKALSNK